MQKLDAKPSGVAMGRATAISVSFDFPCSSRRKGLKKALRQGKIWHVP